ncbi:MAG TPA: GAF domain-containing protein [Terriglobales bacterium]|nr:GAF domain-containing protein [Terriglobales bacterium]
MKPIGSTAQDKVVLDRESFQQLLEAAYVLQEQHDRSQPHAKRPDYTQALSELVEIQNLIHSNPRDLISISSLIAAKAQKFTGANGAAVGVLKEDELTYKSAIGIAADDSGMPVSVASSLSAHCFASSQTLQSFDALSDRRIPQELCRENGVASLIAVPAFHDGQVAGVLELRFSSKNAFQEQDVRTCQLMAGLLAEALNRAAELDWKQALAAERATMLEALEKIKPQLERMAAEPARPVLPKDSSPQELESVPAEPIKAPEESPSLQCRSCGHKLEKEEFYCGICGAPRPSAEASGGDLQSKWASMWHLKRAAENEKGEADEEDIIDEIPDLPQAGMGEAEADPAEEEEGALAINDLTQPGMRILPALAESKEVIAVEGDGSSPWASASSTKQWLDAIAGNKTWLGRNRANLYLVAAGVLLFAVIAGWGSHPAANAPTSARARRNQAPPLSFGEKVLVELGLAVAPPAPVYKGNPDVRVWEDERTALYYCPGSDLYGKTERGKFSTQRDAQIDQFEPAFRRACE